MNLLPYSRFYLTTMLEKEEFNNKLLGHSQPGQSGYYWFRRPGITFTGDANKEEFKVTKIVPYWNLSPLKIKGKYIYDEKPLIIEVKMYNPFALPVFILVMLVFAGIFINYRENMPWPVITGLFFMFYMIVLIPFNIEAAKAKSVLSSIAEGKN